MSYLTISSALFRYERSKIPHVTYTAQEMQSVCSFRDTKAVMNDRPKTDIPNNIRVCTVLAAPHTKVPENDITPSTIVADLRKHQSRYIPSTCTRVTYMARRIEKKMSVLNFIQVERKRRQTFDIFASRTPYPFRRPARQDTSKIFGGTR